MFVIHYHESFSSYPVIRKLPSLLQSDEALVVPSKAVIGNAKSEIAIRMGDEYPF
jgi:hypothetical protein